MFDKLFSTPAIFTPEPSNSPKIPTNIADTILKFAEGRDTRSLLAEEFPDVDLHLVEHSDHFSIRLMELNEEQEKYLQRLKEADKSIILDTENFAINEKSKGHVIQWYKEQGFKKTSMGYKYTKEQYV